MDNVTSPANSSTGTNGIICASVVQYGHGFLRGDAVFNSALAYLLAQTIIVTTSSRLLGRALAYVKEPLVIAEMIVGIVLGPTVMGRIPGWSDTMFPCHSVRYLKLLSSFGLVLFMFVVGVEIDIQYLRKRGKHAIIASVVSCILCFIFAVPLTFMMHKTAYSNNTNWVSFYLFMGVVMAISALPVLARILGEYKLLSSPLGTLAIGTATVDDLIAWPLLAIVMSLAGSSTWRSIVYEVLASVGFVAGLFLIVQPILKRIVARATRQKHDNNAQLSHFYFFLLLGIILGCAWICEVLGLTAFIGAMGVGLVIPRNNNLVPQLVQKIEDISVVIFLPLYFTVSGLRTQLGYISTLEAWGLTALIIVFASIPKMVGTAFIARFVAKCSWRESSAFAILLNSKGLVALVAINLGLQNNLITPKMFSMFVVLVLANTLLAAPAMYFIQSVKRGGKKKQREGGAEETAVDTVAGGSAVRGPSNIPELTIFVYTADPEKAPFLLSAAAAFTSSASTATKRRSRVIFVRYISPELRPSVLMSDMGRELLFRDDVARAVRARATVLSLPVEVHFDFSSDPIADLLSLTETFSSSASSLAPLLLTDLPIEKLYHESDQLDRLRSSKVPLSVILFSDMEMGKSSPLFADNEKLVQLFPSPVFSSFYQEILRVERVLLPYLSHSKEEATAFEMLLLMAEGNSLLEADVLCPIGMGHGIVESLQRRLNAAHIRYRIIRTSQPNLRDALRDSLSHLTYSLILIGDAPVIQRDYWLRAVGGDGKEAAEIEMIETRDREMTKDPLMRKVPVMLARMSPLISPSSSSASSRVLTSNV